MSRSRHSAEYWDERYAGEEYGFGSEPNAYLRSQAHHLRRGMSALVPGDGEGRNGVWLARQGLEVTTLDLSEVGAAKARRLAESHGVQIDARQGDLRTWNWPVDRFDVVALLFVHFDVDVRPVLHGRMLAALKPGGLIVIEGFHPDRFGPKGEAGALGRHYSIELLRQDFTAAVELELSEATVKLAEGSWHVGAARVVRGVFQKRV
jgi:SAM-dependent methyltransferase